MSMKLALSLALSASIVEALSHTPAAAFGSGGGCLVVRTGAQDVKIEAYGSDAVRVRAVPSGGKFLDAPDVVSALVPAADGALGAPCGAVDLQKTTGGADVTSGNIKAAVGSDGRLTFTRVSDSQVLLTEKSVRVLAPTTTTPPVPGFLSLDMVFEAVPGERIYGLGQHAAFPWDTDFPINGQLDQKGVPAMLMEPHDGDVTIPVAHSSLGYVMRSTRMRNR